MLSAVDATHKAAMVHLIHLELEIRSGEEGTQEKQSERRLETHVAMRLAEDFLPRA